MVRHLGRGSRSSSNTTKWWGRSLLVFRASTIETSLFIGNFLKRRVRALSETESRTSRVIRTEQGIEGKDLKEQARDFAASAKANNHWATYESVFLTRAMG